MVAITHHCSYGNSIVVMGTNQCSFWKPVGACGRLWVKRVDGKGKRYRLVHVLLLLLLRSP